MCSFTSETTVTTAQGKEAIGTLRVGDTVLAYNPKTHKLELQPILHVWTHSDQDLVDVTITSTPSLHQGKATTSTREKLHTTSEHPFLTAEQGFVAAGQLKIGMHVLRADGTYGVVTGWQVVPGAQVMYNLEVSQDHTFTVGDGQFVVHNKCERDKLRDNLGLKPGDSRVGQHVIPCGLEMHLLVQTSGLDINSADNGIIMQGDPTTALATDEIYHSGPHQAYTQTIEGLLDRRLAALQSSGSLNQANALAAVFETIRDGRYMIAAFNQIEAANSSIPLRLC